MALNAYKTETVKDRGGNITIEYLNNPSFPFKNVYQNKETRVLDKKFSSYNENLQVALESLTRSNIASIDIQNVVFYYFELRKEIGRFFGFTEKEFIYEIEKRATWSRAPCSSPGLAKALKGGYFHKIKVRGEEVIFPYNL
jgi:hypothetical protein